jgi:RNA-binding protein YlmH
VFTFGGYDGAERQMLFVLPSFLSDMDGEPEEKAKMYCGEEFERAVKAIKIRGSGYRELSHRDYLGSLLSLGIERFSLGDIVVQDEYSAVVFCTEKIFDYLVGSVDKIASDKVTVTEFIPDEGFSVKREFAPIRDTVASNRLDCVVGALTNLSREKAQTLIRSGLCEVNYIIEQRVDVEVKENSIVTLRGYGKYQVVSFDGETKRGRLRLIAQKYV